MDLWFRRIGWHELDLLSVKFKFISVSTMKVPPMSDWPYLRKISGNKKRFTNSSLPWKELKKEIIFSFENKIKTIMNAWQWAPHSRSIERKQKFHYLLSRSKNILIKVDFGPKTLLFRTQTVFNFCLSSLVSDLYVITLKFGIPQPVYFNLSKILPNLCNILVQKLKCAENLFFHSFWTWKLASKVAYLWKFAFFSLQPRLPKMVKIVVIQRLQKWCIGY